MRKVEKSDEELKILWDSAWIFWDSTRLWEILQVLFKILWAIPRDSERFWEIQFEEVWFNMNNMIHFRQVWSILNKFDPIWTCLIQFGQIWSILDNFDPIWTCLIHFEQVWSNLDKFDPIWTSLIQFEPDWSTLEKFDPF